MTIQMTFFKKPYVYIWLLFTTLIFAACSSPVYEPSVEFEPTVESALDSPADDSKTQQPYPAPESQLDEITKENASGYPAPSENIAPVAPTAVSTLTPPPMCEYKFTERKQLTPSTTNLIAFFDPVEIAHNKMGFQISDWLPDNQSLLILQDDAGKQIISTLNVNTGEIKDYATRIGIPGNPIWLEERQGIAYVDVTTEGWRLEFSDAVSDSPQMLFADIASVYLAINHKTSELTTIISDNGSQLARVTTNNQVAPLMSEKAILTDATVPISADSMFRLVWSPDGNWLVQYKQNQLRILDSISGSNCQLDIKDYRGRGEGRILYAQWSPSSRYLGMILYTETVPLTELSILDTVTGEIHIIDKILQDENAPSTLTINDFAWSPTDQYVIVKAHTENSEEDNILPYRFVLIDIENEQAISILPTYTFSGAGQSLAWSPDSSLIVYRCPSDSSDHICMMKANVQNH